MQLNLKKPLLNLNEDPIIDENKEQILMSRWIANQLAQGSDKQNAALHYAWSMELWKTGVIEDIDRSNRDKLLNFIKGLEAPVMIVGQIIKEFETAEAALNGKTKLEKVKA